MRVLALLSVLSSLAVADEVKELTAWYRARKSLPDLAATAFVVVEFQGRPHEWGFLQPGRRVLTGDLRTFAFAPARYRLRGREFGRFVSAELGRLGRGDRDLLFNLFDRKQEDPYARFAVLIVAAECRGEHELAREVFALARRWLGNPAADLRGGLALAAVHRQRARVARPELSWAALAAEYELLRADFPARTFVADLESFRATASIAPEERLAHALRDARRGWRERDGPSRRQVERGFAAVPDLLSLATGDRRFTRIVRVDRNVSEPVRLGAHARTLVGMIAGRRFDTAREVREWWAMAGPMGEEAYLVRTVRLGGPGAAGLAERLVRLAPDRATAAIRRGLAATPGDRDRVRMVRALGASRPDSIALLRDILQEDAGGAAVAVIAAELLWASDPDFVGKSLEARWTAEPGPLLARAMSRLGLPFDPRRLALRERLDLAGPETPEAVLVKLLDDVGFVGGEVDGLRRFMRVCDVAARSLARRAPERYDFDDDAPEPVRDRTIASIRNRYRVGLGLEALPEPAPPRAPHLDLNVALDLGALLVRRPQEALRRIDEIGIAAAPWVARWLNRRVDRATRQSLEDVQRTLHTTLAVAEVHGSKTLLEHLLRAKGHAFDGHEVLSWLVSRSDQTLSGLDRYTFVLWREPGMPGICVRVVAGAKAARKSPRHIALVRSGGRVLFTAFGSGRPLDGLNHEFTNNAEQALRAKDPFEIKVVVRR